MKFKVRLQECNTRNINNRIYTREVIQKAIDQMSPNIVQRRAFVVNRSPEDDKVCLNDVIGRINKMEIENDVLMAEIDIFENNKNKKYIKKIESGELGVFAAGMGSLSEQIGGLNVVNDDYIMTSLFLSPQTKPLKPEKL